MALYRHTQFGTFTAAFLAGAIACIAILGYALGWSPVASGVLVILLLAFVLFHSLTVEVDGRHLNARFGVGLIRKRLDIREIKDAYPVRNRWFYGWGIHMTPHGWLYNVSGLGAVEIVFTSGKRCRIGTDQPNELAQAIKKHVRVSAS